MTCRIKEAEAEIEKLEAALNQINAIATDNIEVKCMREIISIIANAVYQDYKVPF